MTQAQIQSLTGQKEFAFNIAPRIKKEYDAINGTCEATGTCS
jgi:hypothetical protein